jgi:regulator of sigma E protease
VDVAIKLLGFLATIAIVVTWHELGHYWAAKWAGVKVLRFSVGFGNIVKKWVRGPDKEEWAISAIPLGGYVKMLDEREAPVPPADQHRTFNRASLTKRSIIVAAGPFANFVLAIALLGALNMGGVPETRALVESPRPGSAAAKAGLKLGDEIVKVNGEAVASWNDARWRVLISAGDTANLVVRDQNNKEHEIALAVAAPSGDEKIDPVTATGLALWNPLPPVVGTLTADGVAKSGGMREGDRVVKINGEPITRWVEFSQKISTSPKQPLNLEVERAGQIVALSLIPAAQMVEGKEVGRLGVAAKIDTALLEKTQRTVHYGPIDALQRAAVRTWDLSVFTLKIMGKIVTGQASMKNISGPVAMADYAGQSLQSGATSFLAFIALISISIGVINLLPVPMLDGGHLLYHAIEAVRGKPPSERMLEWGQRIGVSFVVALMGLALFNDLTRYLIGK